MAIEAADDVVVTPPQNAPMSPIEGSVSKNHQTNTEKIIVNNLLLSSHWYEGKEEDIPWKLVALEAVKRLQTIPRAASAEGNPSTSSKNPQDLQELKESVQTLREEVQKAVQEFQNPSAPKETRGPRSWANIAAAAPHHATPVRAPRRPAPAGTQTLRKRREIIVRVSGAQANASQAKSIDQILRDVQNASSIQREQITTARRLPSGDIAIQTVSSEARLALERNPQWAKGIAENASIIRKTFAVLAHGARTNLDTSNQGALLTKLHAANQKLHPELEILRVAWPKKVVDSGKAHSSLIVEVATELMANNLLDHGFNDTHRELDCELFVKEARITQCFKCYQFGHPAKRCRNDPFCHNCGKSHDPRGCNTQPERMHCANCKQEGHKPWMRKCPKWKEAVEGSKNILQNRPIRYREVAPSSSPDPPPIPTIPSSSAPPAPTSSPRAQSLSPSPPSSSAPTAVASRDHSSSRAPPSSQSSSSPSPPDKPPSYLGKRKEVSGPLLSSQPAKRGRPPVVPRIAMSGLQVSRQTKPFFPTSNQIPEVLEPEQTGRSQSNPPSVPTANLPPSPTEC